MGWQRLLVLGLGLSLMLGGCPRPSLNPEEESTLPRMITVENAGWEMPETEIKASQPRRVVFALKDTYDPETGEHGDLYQAQVWAGAVAAGEDFGVTVELLPNQCHTCAEDQIRAIANRIEAGDVDGLVVMVTDSVRLANVIERAIAQGIPVIAMDTPVNSDQLVSFIVFDNVAGGKLMGEWVVEQLGGKGNVLLLNGALAQQNALDRQQGFLMGLNTGNIDILETQTGEWSEEKAEEITTDWLARFPDVDAIVAANYAMAQGASNAAVKAGRREEILITGFDAMPPVMEALKAGAIDATINQMPDFQARLSLQLLLRHLENGEDFPDRIFLPRIHLIDRTNVEDLALPAGN
ncbi:sugar ABC transporter substrate-binding protein [Spirulina sp. CCNP1310]|uniref:sugar ABC transporter substrate-binding protein n=1 Tax=Spirulina sp. CCNP1310 TaxID=3110249 RepID=UPI002B205E90|nr:sugar ABC transporter substrate-binding protein [Spirulina sp. CCNP1310]MEA5418726.1 sugar ABC transporter substrate-binding protein [Spirulina sp. CCNP1310]